MKLLSFVVLSPCNRERVTGMLRRVSTEVINLCQRVISIDGIFSGRCRSSIQTLEECISCSLAWKNIYKKVSWLTLSPETTGLRMKGRMPKITDVWQLCWPQISRV